MTSGKCFGKDRDAKWSGYNVWRENTLQAKIARRTPLPEPGICYTRFLLPPPEENWRTSAM